jgi:hypothetical protein
MTKRLLSHKRQVAQSRLDQQPDLPLEEGEALLAVDRVALTTNNLTYAALGEAMQYWQFFPSGEPEWGQLPAWGFANVVASRSEGVSVGERYYGYFPLATQLRVRPVRANERGFQDGAPHRAPLVAVYNHYARCGADPSYDARFENLIALFRPLFGTGLFAADFLVDNALFGARRVLVSSASSKTAYATAYCLRESDVELVALTSAANRSFVEQLGCYQRVLSYHEPLEPGVPSVYLDFSGDAALRQRVHDQVELTYDCSVGFTQGTPPRPVSRGPAPVFFFVFDQIKKRRAEWGPEQVDRRVAETQRAFFTRVCDPEQPWIKVVEHRGLEAAAALIAEFARGHVDPLLGHIVSIA